MKFIYFTDPGHGWLKVPRSLLKDLGIEAKITNFSYQRGDYVYLEEDLDYATFFKAYGMKEEQVIQRHTNRRSKIRSYRPYYLEGATKIVRNIMTGEDVVIPADTPWFCSPASESYWSM
jgi:hypothetical protein